MCRFSCFFPALFFCLTLALGEEREFVEPVDASGAPSTFYRPLNPSEKEVENAKKVLEKAWEISDSTSVETLRQVVQCALGQTTLPDELREATRKLYLADQKNYQLFLTQKAKQAARRLLSHHDASSSDREIGWRLFLDTIAMECLQSGAQNAQMNEALRELEALPEELRYPARKTVVWRLDLWKKLSRSEPFSLQDVQKFAEDGLSNGILNARMLLELVDICAGPAMLDPSILQLPDPAQAEAFAQKAAEWRCSGRFTPEERETFLANLEVFVCACELCVELRKMRELGSLDAYLGKSRGKLEGIFERIEATFKKLADQKNLRLTGAFERLLVFTPPLGEVFPERKEGFKATFVRMIQNCPLEEMAESQRVQYREDLIKNWSGETGR
ncbi:MAG: hypothetical protein Q4D38_04275 [Planctomycetia bacterium]|nr:hypothetical protein [Planctomycetia bacterium]